MSLVTAWPIDCVTQETEYQTGRLLRVYTCMHMQEGTCIFTCQLQMLVLETFRKSNPQPHHRHRCHQQSLRVVLWSSQTFRRMWKRIRQYSCASRQDKLLLGSKRRNEIKTPDQYSVIEPLVCYCGNPLGVHTRLPRLISHGWRCGLGSDASKGFAEFRFPFKVWSVLLPLVQTHAVCQWLCSHAQLQFVERQNLACLQQFLDIHKDYMHIE